jgi:iron uptake system component EfeO
MLPRRAVTVVLAGCAVLAVTVGLVTTHAAHRPSRASSTFSVVAGTDVCGSGWPGTMQTAQAGTQTFRISNQSVAGVEVQLVDPHSGAVFLDAEGLGSGAEHTYRVRLSRGAYRFRCLPADADAVTGPVVHVAGAPRIAGATPGVLPVTRNDLIPAAKRYGDWIESRLPVLLADVRTLDDDLHRGDDAAARRDWLTAHLEYEQLGAAYGAFGDDDTAIDGAPAPGHTALDDPDLAGFHRIEALLWDGTITPATAPADALVAAVEHLQRTFPTARVDPLDVGLRAHEILEDASQSDATGRTDAGSHSELATIDAEVVGTQEALEPLRDVLRTRYADLPAADRALATLRDDLASHRAADGSWAALDRLDRHDREQLDADLGAALELLAPVAAICDPRRTS